MILVGRGVVVTTACGLSPSLKPKQRLIEGVGFPPGGELVAPQLHVLLAPEPVGLLGREEPAHRAVRPFEAQVGGEEARPLIGPAAGENAGFAGDHGVAHVGEGRADQVDDRVGLHPVAHRFGARAGLAGAAAGQDEPDDPVARRRRLVGARPERPVVIQLRAFERRHRLDEPDAGAGFEFENVAGPLDLCARGQVRAPPAGARGAARLRFVAHSAGLLDADPRLWRSETRLGRLSAERLEGIGGFASVICAWMGWLERTRTRREAAAGRAGREEFGGEEERAVARSRTSRTCLTMPPPASKRKLLFLFCSTRQ